MLSLSQPQAFGCHIDSPSGLKLLLIKVRLVNTTVLTHDLILDEHANLAYITKTWLAAGRGLSLSSMCHPGFLLQYHDGWGGVFIVVH